MIDVLLFAAAEMNSMERYFSQWTVWPIILLLVGLGLLIVEMITPGLGAPGICGGIAIVAAVALQAKTLTDALITIAAVIVVVFILGFIIFRSFNKGRLSKTDIVLEDVIDSEANENAAVKELVGTTGFALTELRPSGIGLFDDKRLDIITVGDFVGKGEPIEIIAVEGIKILVRKKTV